MATAPKQVTNILPTIAPRLPAATTQYGQQYQDQFTNILRLYFNGIDTTFGGLLGNANTTLGTHPGGGYLAFPYAAIQRTTNKTFTANTATLVTCDTNDYINDCTNTGSDGIVVNVGGIYNYQFSIQFANTDTQIHTAYVWLRINNVDVPGTASKWDIPNKHGGVDGYLVGAANFYVSLNPGDYVSLFAAVDQAYVPATTTGIYMEAYAAQTSPPAAFAMPSLPSVAVTLSFVSRLPA